MAKVLITGKSGFVGTYLAKQLQHHEVYGFDLSNNQNLLDYEQVRNTIDTIRPDYIYHLAAQAFVGESFDDPTRAIEVNTIGSINIIRASLKMSLNPKILLAGTSEEYGDGEVDEEAKLQPRSPYAISKAAMDYFGQLYAQSRLNIVITRAFNHTGAGRGEMYAESSWAKQIAEIEKGKQDIIYHGNLESIRNYTDVRDMVKAYELAIDLPSGVYNICSDQNLTMQEVLDKLCSMSPAKPKAMEDPMRLRPSDFSFKKPSCKKFTDLVEWKPEFKIDQTLEDILNYWRERV